MNLDLELMKGPQQDFVLSDKRFCAYIGGRDSGKTASLVFKMMKYLSEHPGADIMGTLPQLNRIRSILIPAMRKFFGKYQGILWEWKRKDNEIYFPAWDSTLFLRAADDPDTIRGTRVAAGFMDEVAEGDQLEAFLILVDAINETGGDKNYLNQLWVTSTPKDTKMWIKEVWGDKLDPDTQEPLTDPEEYPLFRMKTKDNPFAPKWVHERAERLQTTRRGRMEYGGEFLTIEGIALPELKESIHRKAPSEDVVFKRFVTGFDLGAVSPTSLILIGEDEQGRLWALKEFYKRNAIPEDWADWLGENNVSDVRCDPSISDDQMKVWRRRYLLPRMQRAMAVRGFEDRIGVLASRLEPRFDGKPGLFISPQCPNLWTELENLAYARVKGREHQVNKWAPGVLDHAYDALCYGLSAWDKKRYHRPQGLEISHAR